MEITPSLKELVRLVIDTQFGYRIDHLIEINDREKLIKLKDGLPNILNSEEAAQLRILVNEEGRVCLGEIIIGYIKKIEDFLNK